ncbi:MAG: hypothetical protein HYR66_07545 [Sphingobacteriales bacterium]|nr:hypothetical protein [Sphingobacteriales bacterium]MBI3718408.1 hypothetical protein [Sphingobacteriales bacterium]
MNKNDIVQFVCFDTDMETAIFFSLMNNYLRQNKVPNTSIHETQNGRFKYISRHIALKNDFHFVFSKAKYNDSSAKPNLKITQAGGYGILQQNHQPDSDTELATVLVFLQQGTIDITAFHGLENYKYLNIYEAYYENCLYPFILEFFTQEYHADELMKELKRQPEFAYAGIYKECLAQEA